MKYTARPGEPAGQSIPWEVDGQGERISFLLTPDKWQVNLRGVLAQAFSLVIINLKIMVYIGVEQNGLVVLRFLLSV